MCDLIDLNSPNPKKLHGISKLASPLIPGPPTPVDDKIQTNIDFVAHGKRSSLDNNPFDKVFKETAEYAAKKDDPFECVLEKAKQQNADKEYREDFTPKRRRHSDVLKLNKTLDEPLLHEILNKNFYLSRHQTVVKDFTSNDSQEDNGGSGSGEAKSRILNGLKSPSIIVCPPSPGNCSVLNQSAMNDSLLEGSGSSREPQTEEKEADTPFLSGETVKEGICDLEITNVPLEPLKHGRSLSQGSKKLPQTEEKEKDSLFRPRSRSTIDTLKPSGVGSKSRFSSASSASSAGDFANNAFIETGSITNSESFDLSRISATPKLSYSSYGSMGSLNSCSSKNRAFILEDQSSRAVGSSSTKSSFNLSSISRSAGNFLAKTPLKTPVRITDLELRFERLKLQSTGSVGGLPLYSPNRKVQSFLRSDRAESGDGSEARLIDTGEDCAMEKRDSVANYSSDSVFIENSNVDQSVFREAKLLARTFDELAHQSTSTSFSSGDDLLYSRPRWNFDILPVSDDDEAVVDNLIELPVSPPKNEAELRTSPNKDAGEITEKKLVSDEIRELETQFIDQDAGRNKVMAATLLLDLEKIVHRENNPEAITLLENLEKVLGVKYESNAQLLATCLQGTNNLSKSPKKYANKLGSNENIRLESLEKSEEDNTDAGPSDGAKIPKINNDESLGMNLNVQAAVSKGEKSIIADLSSAVEENRDNLSEKTENIKNASENERKKTLVDQTEALELITNLSKLLGGPNNDSSPLSLLTNLRQVLNLATNQLNFENSQITKSQNQESPREIHTEKPLAKPKVDAVKMGRKKSSDSLTKVQSSVPRINKRSMSFSGVQRSVVVPTAILSKEKTKPHSKSFKKALSYDAVPKPDKLEKSSTIVPEVPRARASTLSGTGKYKLKKKSESEGVAGKKGPLKALLPVGNMQRRGSMSGKVAPISLSRTPPKSSSSAASNFTSAMSSTPNQTVALIVSKQSPKTKPVASSTPDGGGSKARKMRLQFSKNNAKPKFSCNISPVTPLPTQGITGGVVSKGLPKNYRHNKTLSPPKRRSSQEALALNTTESSIPKYSPMSGFSRRNSKETIKSLETSGSPNTSSAKSQTPKKSPFVNRKSESHIPQSPLKTVNNQKAKFKPFNLISKLRRGSNGSSVSDKENCA